MFDVSNYYKEKVENFFPTDNITIILSLIQFRIRIYDYPSLMTVYYMITIATITIVLVSFWSQMKEDL